MSSLLTNLDPSKRVLKRAQYEAFEFSLQEGDILVRNESHADPSEHEYRVTIEDGIPTSCECPADEHAEEACKHRVGVAIRPAILAAASEIQALTDGGTEARQPLEREPNPISDEAPEPGCEHLDEDFPCWECVRTDRRELPDR